MRLRVVLLLLVCTSLTSCVPSSEASSSHDKYMEKLKAYEGCKNNGGVHSSNTPRGGVTLYLCNDRTVKW